MKNLNAEQILEELKINEEVLNIYQYGSQVYGTTNENSDQDFIIVTKGSFLKSGAFKQNAISNSDRTIQGVLYSRSGFQDAINNYDISALECLSLDSDKVVRSKWLFKIQKWDPKEMSKNIISKASGSFHLADLQAKDGEKAMAKKGVFHALRILHFGLQLKDHQRVVNFKECNWIWEAIKDDEDFDTRNYMTQRNELIGRLKF